MSVHRSIRSIPLLAAAALAPLAQVQAAPGCATAGAASVTLGTVAEVAPGAVRNFSLRLETGQGVIVDLANLRPKPAARSEEGEGDHDHGEAAKPPLPRNVRLCDAKGVLLAPQPGEVFEKGGSVSATDDGERLRFVATSGGTYVISVTAADEPRELLVRRRVVGTTPPPIISARLDSTQKGSVSSGAPVVFTFDGTAGQWVELKSTSEKDTVLRLAGPDRQGNYSVIAENDDSDGLNPRLRRRLPLAGTYYLQVDSLSEEVGDFELALTRTSAPKPPAPPAALRLGNQVSDKLKDGDDVRLYTLSVTAGRSYRLELNAEYDGVVAIGLPNPVETDADPDKPDASFSEVKSQDSGTTGTERLNFTARSSGQLLVRVKSFGIKETDGSYTLTATDQGG